MNCATEPVLNLMRSCLHMSSGLVYFESAGDLMGIGPCKVGRTYFVLDSEKYLADTLR